MQVERSVHRWPYIAALAMLLVLCLTVPLFWQSTGCPESAAVGGRSAWPPAGFEYPAVQSRRLPQAGFCDPSIPTSDPLVDRWLTLHPVVVDPRSARQPHAGDPNLLSDFFADVCPAGRKPKGAVIGPRAWALLFHTGHHLTTPPGQWTAAAVRRVAVLIGQLGTRVAQSAPSPRRHVVRMHGAAERLALVPPRLSSAEPAQRPDSPPAAAPAYPKPWSSPTTVVRRLQRLSAHPPTADWARTTLAQLRQLTEVEQLTEAQMTRGLARLNEAAAAARELARETTNDRARAELLRTHWGLVRRLESWSLLQQITLDSGRARRFASRPAPGERIAPGLSEPDDGSVDFYRLSAALESYERTGRVRLARAIAQQQRQLADAPDSARRELAGQIEQHYRNANVRVALTAELLERLVPRTSSEVRPVRDRIVGTPVRGRSQTFTENRVRLLPGDGRWQAALESVGRVESKTVADGGQAKLLTDATTSFTAEKTVVVGSTGVQLGASHVETHNHSRLAGVRSEFDWMPIVGDVVRNVAVEQYRKNRPRARAEVECKVAQQVTQQVDGRTDDAVRRADSEVRTRLVQPLREAGVEITPIELITTADRVVGRLRVAGQQQLGGHTPRPRAPADSLASIQVHESAFTNAALAVELDRRRFSAPELQQHLRERITRLQDRPALEVDPDTEFRFADRDAVQCHIAEGRLEVILALVEVRLEGRPVRNFRVHAFYKPVIDGLEAELVRDGGLGIEGRLGAADRARMYNVFNQVFSEERALPIIELDDPIDSRWSDLMITQCVLEDGWLGLAVGPAYRDRTAQRSRMLEK